jgi:hypothetical protein
MPIHDLGYRSWQGRLTAGWLRFWPITETGLRLAWQGRPLRRLIMFAWLPAVYLAAGFFFYEQARYQFQESAEQGPASGRPALAPQFGPGFSEDGDRPPSRRGQPRRSTGYGLHNRNFDQFRQFATMLPIPDTVKQRLEDRHYVWSFLLWVFFRYPQGVVMVLVVGLVAPSLIAQDVRTRAFLLYFSRPLTRLEYVLGKMATVWAYLALITLLPALGLYGVAVSMSNELGVVVDTWDLPLRIGAASLVLIIPTTLMALAFSSLTSETRYASFAWFAFWAIGWVTYMTVSSNLGTQMSKYWTLLSLYHTMGEVQHWIFGLQKDTGTLGAGLAGIELVALTVVSWLILYRRVSAPMRV